MLGRLHEAGAETGRQLKQLQVRSAQVKSCTGGTHTLLNNVSLAGTGRCRTPGFSLMDGARMSLRLITYTTCDKSIDSQSEINICLG